MNGCSELTKYTLFDVTQAVSPTVHAIIKQPLSAMSAQKTCLVGFQDHIIWSPLISKLLPLHLWPTRLSSHPSYKLDPFFHSIPSAWALRNPLPYPWQLSRPQWSSNWVYLLLYLVTTSIKLAPVNIRAVEQKKILLRHIFKNPRSPAMKYHKYSLEGIIPIWIRLPRPSVKSNLKALLKLPR